MMRRPAAAGAALRRRPAAAAEVPPHVVAAAQQAIRDEGWSELVALGDDVRRKHIMWTHTKTDDPTLRQGGLGVDWVVAIREAK